MCFLIFNKNNDMIFNHIRNLSSFSFSITLMTQIAYSFSFAFFEIKSLTLWRKKL